MLGKRLSKFLNLLLLIGCILYSACEFGEENEGWTSSETVEEIWIIDISGENDLLLAKGSCPRFGPAGEKVFYLRDEDIHVVDTNGENDQVIAASQKYISEFECWSDKILFSAYSFSSRTNDILIVNGNGGGFQNLSNSEDAYEFHPSFSRDGSQIVYSTRSSLMVADLFGSSKSVLESDTTYFWHPKFNFSGDKVVYVELYFNKAGKNIRLLDLKNNSSELLLANAEEFSISPTRDEMVYPDPYLYSVDLNSMEKRQLSTRIGAAPAYSQDGNRAIFVLWIGSIVIIDLEQGSEMQINIGKDRIDSAILSPDNKKLIYTRRYSISIYHPPN